MTHEASQLPELAQTMPKPSGGGEGNGVNRAPSRSEWALYDSERPHM